MPPQVTRPAAILSTNKDATVFGVSMQVQRRPACVLHGLLGMSSQEAAKMSVTGLTAVCDSHQAALDQTDTLTGPELQPMESAQQVALLLPEPQSQSDTVQPPHLCIVSWWTICRRVAP